MIPLARRTNETFRHNIDLEFTHRFAGNGWAVLEVFDEEWCRIARTTSDSVEDRAFMAWTKLLTPGTPITGDRLDALESLREDLSLGRKTIEGTHIRGIPS